MIGLTSPNSGDRTRFFVGAVVREVDAGGTGDVPLAEGEAVGRGVGWATGFRLAEEVDEEALALDVRAATLRRRVPLLAYLCVKTDGRKALRKLRKRQLDRNDEMEGRT